MKQFIYLSAFIAFFAAACQNQNQVVMCHDTSVLPTNADTEFAKFSSNKAFRDMHPSPLPTDTVHRGKTVDFPVADGKNGAAYAVMSDKPTTKYLLLLHEWWGLNDYVKNEADFWSKDLNINVLAIDLYDGKVATKPEEAGALMQGNDRVRSAAIIEGAIQFAGEKADFRTMGWCFGGGWSLQTALLAKDKLKGCVMFYGMPEKDVERLKTLQSDVLFVHASKDKWINDAVVSEFETNMKTAGKSLTVKRYDADHAFANPSSPRYNDAAAKEARAVVKAYLETK